MGLESYPVGGFSDSISFMDFSSYVIVPDGLLGQWSQWYDLAGMIKRYRTKGSVELFDPSHLMRILGLFGSVIPLDSGWHLML